MKPVSFLVSWGAQLILEKPVRKLSLIEMINQLEQSGKQINELLAVCTDTPGNRRQLCHLIGIERWGQRRLRVALGEPFLTEEYDHYRPSDERPWNELTSDWEVTRKATLALVNDLGQVDTLNNIKILHNQYGSLSIKAWLRYLDVHASSEGKRLK